MPGIEETLMNFLRQYLPQSKPQTPDYPTPNVIWSMPSNTPLPERLARAKQESGQENVDTKELEKNIRDWYGKAQQGEHMVKSPVDADLQGTEWERQYNSYVFNRNNMLRQVSGVDEAFKLGKMSRADWEKYQIMISPGLDALNAKIKQLDQQRMQKAQQVLKGMHGDYRI